MTITYCDACGSSEIVAKDVMAFGYKKFDLCPLCNKRLMDILTRREWKKPEVRAV